jgi:integrase
MWHSGLRISEVISLKVANVDFTKGWQYGKTFLKKRKNKGESYTLIDREFLPAMKKYRDEM